MSNFVNRMCIKSNKLNAGVAFLLAFICVEALCEINVLGIAHVHSLSIMPFFLIVIGWLGYNFFQKYVFNLWIVLVAFLITVLCVTGMCVRLSSGSGIIGDYGKSILVIGLSATPAMAYVLCYIVDKGIAICKYDEGRHISERAYFWCCLLGIFISWIPVWLAYYPGIFAYDVKSQIRQIQSNEFTTHHPLLHTVILGAFYKFGDMIDKCNWGIVLYCMFQMFILASAMAYAMLYLYRKRVNRVARVVILLFFAFCPINTVLAISVTKDVLFAAFVLLMMVFVLQWLDRAEDNGEKRRLSFFIVISGIMVYLLRNNTKYVMFVWVIIFSLYIAMKKMKVKIKILGISMMAGIVLGGALLGYGLEQCFEAKSGRINEMCSVPCVQMARCAVCLGEELDEKLAQNYAELGIVATNYSPILADPIKGDAIIEGQEILFLKSWLESIREYPGVCIDAFIYLHSGNLFLDDISNAYIYGANLQNRQGYLLTDTKEGFGVKHESKFSWLESIYENLFSANQYQDILGLSVFFAPAFYVYGLLICILCSILSGNKNVILMGIFLGLYYGTILLGPCSLIRYMYPLVVCVPILLAKCFTEVVRCTWKKEIVCNTR